MNFIYFLGRFHVLALHVPIGLIVAVLVLELLSRRERFRYLQAGAPFLWSATAIAAVVTVVLGYMHFAEGGFAGGSGPQHRTFGTTLAVLLVFFAVLRSSRFAANYAPVFLPAAVIMTLLATITGHYGGNLTHGSTFLVEYAPAPIRAIMGLGPRRPPVTHLEEADPYYDVIAPILQSHCSKCHNDDKRQGDLNLMSYDGILHGGETGSVVVAGKPQVSDLLRRVALPSDDEEFMPAEGNTPLTPEQIAIVEWWVTAGLPVDIAIGRLDTPPDPNVEADLRAELGLD